MILLDVYCISINCSLQKSAMQQKMIYPNLYPPSSKSIYIFMLENEPNMLKFYSMKIKVCGAWAWKIFKNYSIKQLLSLKNLKLPN
jgi:hypothetical protein